MKKIAYIIIAWFIPLFCGGCSHDTALEIPDSETTLVNLSISVALSDISQAGTRANDTYPTPPINDNEKIQSLRIIVVRNPDTDNIVEQNRIYNLQSAPTTDYYAEKMKVVGNEKKRIYLLVNEGAEMTTPGFPAKRKLIDYDFNKIQLGSPFPTEVISNLTILLNGATEKIDGLLPMSECHTIDVKSEDYECKLFVTRATTKLTFNITNKSLQPVNITKLAIDKMAREAYYLPRNATYTEKETEKGEIYKEITSFDVPPQSGYYTYDAPQSLTGELKNGETRTNNNQPIYLLEGKHTDANNNENPYLLTLGVNGAELKSYLPNLPQLPRNTYVVVNITINEQEMDCVVDVRPYTEVILDPGFGI
ncbi:hypothetical protein [uncultured Bacteroides sp.]|uniref:hypothetical protein n=1 Tax=uncultured Bacteroides sp. TaxID=162156 RepID=UPI0025F3900D|nr:hypothetical protein [uncultured Bacteroides sp.]